jgi:hypothetical protein
MKWKMILRLLIILWVTLQFSMLKAQNSLISSEKYYALSVYNFTRFVKCPDRFSDQPF